MNWRELPGRKMEQLQHSAQLFTFPQGSWFMPPAVPYLGTDMSSLMLGFIDIYERMASLATSRNLPGRFLPQTPYSIIRLSFAYTNVSPR